MPTNGAGPTSSSVSPKVIVPSVTVISLLVLITFIGAVIIFVRAYKKRRRHPSHAEKEDAEAGYRERRGSMMKSGMRSSGVFERPSSVVRPPPRAAKKGSPTLVQEVRDLVSQGFRFTRTNQEGLERDVVAGQGYTMQHAHKGSESSTAPMIGKIERLTGNALSNDFYTERASGSGHSRGNSVNIAVEPKHRSYPSISTKNIAPATSSKPLTLDTNLSPISPETDISTSRDFSPYNDHTNVFKSLSPPPATPNAIALKYPNVTALTRANPSGESSSSKPAGRLPNRFPHSQLYLGSHLAEHISMQYNRLKEPRKPSPQNTPSPDRSPNPPLSAAFGGFSILRKSSRSTSTSSEPTDDSQPLEPVDTSHIQRLSWSGRSVLELDTPSPTKEYNAPPPVQPPQSNPHALRRIDKNLPVEPASPPKFVPSKLRTSAFGSRRRYEEYPPMPPIPPDPIESSLPAMTRSTSNSKMSVLSVPSTISSFNTTFTGRATGLSPTPARHSPRNTPDYEDTISSDRRSIGASTVLTATSEISNMTEVSLEMEMRRIRERAKRASHERRDARRRNEERQGGPGSSGNARIGHRFF